MRELAQSSLGSGMGCTAGRRDSIMGSTVVALLTKGNRAASIWAVIVAVTLAWSVLPGTTCYIRSSLMNTRTPIGSGRSQAACPDPSASGGWAFGSGSHRVPEYLVMLSYLYRADLCAITSCCRIAQCTDLYNYCTDRTHGGHMCGDMVDTL